MLSALIPVFCVILLGYALKRFGFPGDGFWPHAERITYYVFFPALLMNTLSRADFSSMDAGPMGLAMAGSVVAVSLVLLALRRELPFDGPAFTSVFQGSIRPNTYVGLAGASALFGPQGLALASVALVCLIPTVNLLCVPTVSRYGQRHSRGLAPTLVEIARNPLILSCLAGFLLNVLAPPFPEPVTRFVDILGRASLPIGLLAVGAGLRFSGLKARIPAVAAASLLKLAILPLLCALACHILGVEGPSRTVAVLFTGIPVSASSYILARQLGGDERVMAAVITAQVIISAFTLPLVLSLAG